MKITDVILSAIIKKGVLYEARNVNSDVVIPIVVDGSITEIKVNIKCDHMTLKIEKD